MQPSTSSLFEREMRDQIAAAEAGVLESLATADPLLIGAARGHLDGLVSLAHRNGLNIKPLILEDAVIDPVTAADPIEIVEQSAAS
jgi:hypothetical protein